MRANITQELEEIDKGQYGEEIRWPIYRALTKLAGTTLYIYIVDNLGNYMVTSEGWYVVAKE